nr:hypothetical protein [Tanacetum cinerariifolium]
MIRSPLHTQNQVFQKLENANVELEFQVFNYAKENAHLKATYKNLFDSISVSRAQTVTKITSLQDELQCNIYKNAKLRTQLFKKVFDKKANTQDSSKNTKFAKQPIAEILSKIGETNALSKPVTSNFVSTPQVSKGVNYAKKLENANVELEFQVLNYARENAHLKATYNNLFDSISVSRVQTETKIASLQNELQCNIYKNAKLRTQLFKKVSDQKDNTHDSSKNTKFAKQPIAEILPKIGVDNTTKTRRTQLKRSSKNNKVPYVVKSSYKKNKAADVEENHRNLLSSSNKKHVSSACNNFMLDSQNVYSKVVCAMCKQCLISVNHDDCLLKYVKDKDSHGQKWFHTLLIPLLLEYNLMDKGDHGNNECVIG